VGCSLAVGPRGSLLFLTHVKARIRSCSFIVRHDPTSSTSPFTSACVRVCIWGGVHPIRSEVRHVLVICIREPVNHRYHVAFCGVIASAGRSSRFPARGLSRLQFGIVCSVTHTGLPERRVVLFADYGWHETRLLDIASSVTNRILDCCRGCILESTNVSVFIYLRSVGPFLSSPFLSIALSIASIAFYRAIYSLYSVLPPGTTHSYPFRYCVSTHSPHYSYSSCSI